MPPASDSMTSLLQLTLAASLAAVTLGTAVAVPQLPGASGCVVDLGSCWNGDCSVNLGACRGGDCSLNGGLCEGACMVNGGSCEGACLANAGSCEDRRSTCTVNLSWCADGGTCLVNGAHPPNPAGQTAVPRCHGGSCTVNFGNCTGGGSCTVNLATCDGKAATCTVNAGDCKGGCRVNGPACIVPRGAEGLRVPGRPAAHGN